MEDKLQFTDTALNFHLADCSTDLDRLIDKTQRYINKARERPARYPLEADDYNKQYNLLKVLKLIRKVQNGEITPVDFYYLVDVHKESLSI